MCWTAEETSTRIAGFETVRSAAALYRVTAARMAALKAAPRARICARYVSLLRHLCRWRDPADDRGFDALVIVAHSQGTVITADLLRFLSIERDPELQRLEDGFTDRPGGLPVYLFTVGCPLRQLYSEYFPHLYDWARPVDGPWAEQTPPPDIPENQPPDPRALRVKRWVNGFRSGDYVGRYLWRSDQCAYLFDCPEALLGAPLQDWNAAVARARVLARPVNVSEDESGTRREFCLGAGAHIHYFDATAPAVAVHLDQLIVEACLELPNPASAAP